MTKLFSKAARAKLPKELLDKVVKEDIANLRTRISNAIQIEKAKAAKYNEPKTVDQEVKKFIAESNVKAFNTLLEIKMEDEIDLNYVRFLFNCGKLRTEEEITVATNERNSLKQKVVKSSPEYLKGYHPELVAIVSFFLTPVIGGLFFDVAVTGLSCGIFEFLMFSALLLMIPLFAPSIIITWLYCESHAAKFNVTVDSSLMVASLASVAVGGAIGVARGGGYTAKASAEV